MTTEPIRVQLSRARGWRMPPNTVKVDRTTPWGNPFRIGPGCTAEDAVRRLDMLVSGYVTLCASPSMKDQERWIDHARANLDKIRGKNLACWCKLGRPCHVDILLRVNRKKRGKR